MIISSKITIQIDNSTSTTEKTSVDISIEAGVHMERNVNSNTIVRTVLKWVMVYSIVGNWLLTKRKKKITITSREENRLVKIILISNRIMLRGNIKKFSKNVEGHFLF